MGRSKPPHNPTSDSAPKHGDDGGKPTAGPSPAKQSKADTGKPTAQGRDPRLCHTSRRWLVGSTGKEKLMWRERISAITDEVEFSTPARELDILRAGEQISSPLPEDLKALLIESNGMVDQYGTDVIWPVERIIQDNEYFRSDQTFSQLYAPFHSLIFFGDNGGGDQIAFQADSGNSAVFAWDHETDERIPAADSLEDYVQKYFSSGGVDWFRE